jgi:RsiW-degrading membrane proteinase PrsW (M82 family)
MFLVFLLIITAFLPTVLWLLFFLREDLHPEPKRLIIYTFIAGMIVSVPVLFTQLFFQGLLSSIAQNVILLVAGLALIEEVFKFLAAYLMVHKKAAFDEPVDAMVYMVIAAMGFATVENIFIASNSLSLTSAFAFAGTVKILALRFVGATFLHTLASGLVGYYWAKARWRGHYFSFLTFGVIVATIAHGIFNYLVLEFQDGGLLLYPSIFLVVAAFFVFRDFEKLKRLVVARTGKQRPS